MNHLFRSQALEHKKNQNFGSVSINTPLNYKIFALGYAVFLFLILMIITLGNFCQKHVVKGFLNSTQGVVSVYPKKSGTISQLLVRQGTKVSKGDLLFKIETNYEIDSHHVLQVLKQLDKRKAEIIQEIIQKKLLLKNLNKLLSKKFISIQEMNREVENLNNLKENLNRVQLDIIRYQQEQTYSIRAPVSGQVTTLNTYIGQHVDLAKPLIKLIPLNTTVNAELFIPVREAGFINLGDSVVLHYDAYPYQHFGGFSAHISSISQSILLDEEESKPIIIGEPYYKIYATIDSPTVKLYGKDKVLQPGMTLSAVISGSKRKVWQWLLEPVYSFNGGIWS